MKISLFKTLRGALALLLVLCLTLGAVAPAFAEELELPEDDDRLNGLLEDIQGLMNKYGPEIDPSVEAGTTKGTTIDYKASATSRYVAIGEDTTRENNQGGIKYTTYVPMLAKALGIPFDNRSDNLAKRGLLIENVIPEIIDKKTDAIQGADLITINFSINGFALMAIDELARRESKPTQLDWAKYVHDEAGRKEIKDTLAELEQYLNDAGLGEKLPLLLGGKSITKAKAVSTAAEAFAFGTMAYSNCLPSVIDRIHELNPDATVVVIGMDNPMDGTVLNAGGNMMDIGTYVDKLIQMTDRVAQTAAIARKNTVFVSAPDAFNANDGIEMTETSLLLTYTGLNKNPVGENGYKALPTDEGHAYITQQVLNAFQEERVWGDATGEGDIDYLDAMLILRHAVKLSLLPEDIAEYCDVDGSNGIDYLDAMLVLRRAVKLINKFPVED